VQPVQHAVRLEHQRPQRQLTGQQRAVTKQRLLLAGEVVEERACRHADGVADFLDRQVLQPSVESQPERRIAQRPSGGALFSLAKAAASRAVTDHGTLIARTEKFHKVKCIASARGQMRGLAPRVPLIASLSTQHCRPASLVTALSDDDPGKPSGATGWGHRQVLSHLGG
jgi:hypothetical protein